MLGLACGPTAATLVARQQPASLQPPLGRPAIPAAPACRGTHRHREQPGSNRRDWRAAASAQSDEQLEAEERGGAGDGVQPPSEDEAQFDLEAATAEYLEHCQSTFGKPGLIDFAAGVNGLPKVTLQHPSGSSCDVYLHGGTVTSWRHSDGRELLHLREGNSFNGEDSINGGIQIAWPQYGVGPLPTHGFLQNLHWSVVEACWREPAAADEQPPDAEDADTINDWRPTISLYADTDEEFAKVWPHKFEALYSVTLMQPTPKDMSDNEWMRVAAEDFQPWIQRQKEAKAAEAAARPRAAAVAKRAAEGADGQQTLSPSVLRCLLQVHNCDDSPFTFTTGLRTHFATKDIPRHSKIVKTLGLRGKYVLEYARDPFKPGLTVDDSHNVFFGDMEPKDRVYVDCEAPGEVLFCPGSPAHFEIGNVEGFTDIGITHPTNIVPEEARRFVCMSSARAVRKVTLQPGETWVGEMLLTAHDRYWNLPPWEHAEPEGIPLPDQPTDTLQPRRPAQFSESLTDF